MTQKMRKTLLGVFDLCLSFGAIFTGIMMVQSNYGIFTQYPEEWLSKMPFESWVLPDIIAIVIFGIGNMLSAVFVFKKDSNKPWIMSALMGGVFFVCLIAQMIILGESYLPTLQFLILSIIQLALSGYLFLGYQNKRQLF